MTRYLLPYPPARIGGLPEGIDAVSWDGVAPPPPRRRCSTASSSTACPI
ncbi:hypothetical protein GXW82_39430 [Streptacidiphilus sp. 4-A2]|nr:hypothetical protein [Streptacidiphilus sp. 4-A2]